MLLRRNNDPVWWARRVCIVADADHPFDLLPYGSTELSITPELFTWANASAIAEPFAALVAHLDRLSDDRSKQLEAWAAVARQPVSVVALAAAPGAARAKALLSTLGYDRVLLRQEGQYMSMLGNCLEEILESHLWVVPIFAMAVGVRNPIFIRLISLPLIRRKPLARVRDWAKTARMTAWELELLFRRKGWPPPKRTLDALRLCRGVALVATMEQRPTRDVLARRLGFASGDYLGRRARTLTGEPLGDLVGKDVIDAIRTLGRITRSVN